MNVQKEEKCKCNILMKAREEGPRKEVEDWPLAGTGSSEYRNRTPATELGTDAGWQMWWWENEVVLV